MLIGLGVFAGEKSRSNKLDLKVHQREGENRTCNCERREVQESEGGSESACGSSTADSANETANCRHLLYQQIVSA